MPRKMIKIDEETLISRLQQLRDELGHEPNVNEINACPYLPSSRQLQRKYPSIVYLREKAGFTHTLHTNGIMRSQIVKATNERAAEYEKKIINQMIKKYPQVIRQYAYQQWVEEQKVYKNICADVAIIQDNHVVLIDLLYPKDMSSFGGSLRTKRLKLEKYPPSLFNCTHEIVFVCVNEKITQEMIDTNGTNKGSFTVLSLRSFEEKYL